MNSNHVGSYDLDSDSSKLEFIKVLLDSVVDSNVSSMRA
jgi:hypothetical protein